MDLGAYLKEAGRKPWQSGSHDCCHFPGDWVRTWGRGDPLAKWRGRYSTDQEARRLIRDAGGLVELWQRGLASIGIDGVNEPREGDVGVVLAFGPSGPEHIGAIWTGRRWAFLVEAGLAFASAEFLRVWGMPRG